LSTETVQLEQQAGAGERISLVKIRQVLKYACKIGRPAFIYGKPGIGKSSIVRAVSQELGIGFIDLRLSQILPEDLRGFPKINGVRERQKIVSEQDLEGCLSEGWHFLGTLPSGKVVVQIEDEAGEKTRWIRSEFLPTSGRGILFLDELPNAEPSKQNAALQLVLDRKLGNYVLPEGWLVMAAGNGAEDRSHVFELSSALNNRFINIDFPIPTFEEWFEWGAAKIHPGIFGFLKLKPSMMFKFEPKAKERAWPSLRCYDDKTEVLTIEGFKHFRDLAYSDEIATLDPKTRVLEYHKPTKIFANHYKGKMIHFEEVFYDLLVTPNHKLVAEPTYLGGKPRKDSIIFPTAEEVKTLVENHTIKTVRFLKTCKWQQPGLPYFEPPRVSFRSPHKNCINVEKIPMNTWMRFLGWFLSEGNLLKLKQKHRLNYIIRIRNTNPSYLREIADLVRDMGFTPWTCKNAVAFASKQIYSYLQPLGKMSEKKFPTQALAASTDQLKLLLETFVKGDGWINGNHLTISVGSKLLADGLQELALKIGWSATIHLKINKANISKGRQKDSLSYEVSFLRERYNAPKVYRNSVNLEDYEGTVYCAEVTNHTLLVRRNGKTLWSGNSWEYASDLFKASSNDPSVVRFAVGEGAGIEFEGFWNLRSRMPDPDKVFQDPERAEIPDDLSLQHLMAAMVAERAMQKKDPKTVDAACAIISKLPPELGMMSIKMIVSAKGLTELVFKSRHWKQSLAPRWGKYLVSSNQQ